MAEVDAYHEPPAPICAICYRRSSVFLVREFIDGKGRTLVLCRDCLSHRSLLWERFLDRVEIDLLEHRKQSSDQEE